MHTETHTSINDCKQKFEKLTSYSGCSLHKLTNPTLNFHKVFPP